VDGATFRRVLSTFSQRMSRPLDFGVSLVAATLDITEREAKNVVAVMTDAGVIDERGADRYVIAAGVDVDAFPAPEDLQRCNMWRVREAALADRGVNPHSWRLAPMYQELQEEAPTAAGAKAWFTPRRQELLDLLSALAATIPETDRTVRNTGSSVLAQALTEALWGLCRGIGAIEDADAALRLGLRAVPRSDTGLTAVFLARFASVLVDRHRVGDAINELDAAVRFAREADDDRVLGLVLATRGRALQNAGETVSAVDDLRAALRIAQARRDTRVEGKIQLALGTALRDLSKPDAAENHLTVATGLFGTFGDDLGQARAQAALASVRTTQGRADEALGLLDLALKVLRHNGNPVDIAEACRQRCLALLAQGGWSDAANRAGADAIQHYREYGRHDIAEALRRQLAKASDSLPGST
jgi:tetratricopeptide (TPR) repeat protein